MTPAELAELCDIDLASIESTWQLLKTLTPSDGSRPPDVHEVAAVGTYLNNVYCGVENVLMHFLRFHGQQRPQGDAWHTQLLDLFIESDGSLLPQLFAAIPREKVRLLKGFRHVFRNQYAIDLDWTKLLPLIQQLDDWLRPWMVAVRQASAERLGE